MATTTDERTYAGPSDRADQEDWRSSDPADLDFGLEDDPILDDDRR